MEQTQKIYLGNRAISTGETLAVYNPHDLQLIANTFLAGENEINEAIELGLKALETLKKTPSHQRYAWLMAISEKIKEQREEFATLLSKESAKPIKYALAEIDRSIQTFVIAAEESKRLPKEYISLDWTKAGENKEGLVKYFPVGLVAGITPFNFPLNLAVHKIAPAIASGCPIIIKPASSTPLSCLKLAEIIYQVGLPNGSISVLPCDRNVGNILVMDERIKLLSFTGSPEVGWKMKSQAGKKKVVLELGGNAGLIISESADLPIAIEKSLMGAFAYSGQVCIHTQRIYIHKSIFEQFLEKFKSKVKELNIGNPLGASTDIAAMIDENNAKRVENWVNEALENGAKLIIGGKREGGIYLPTILTNTKTEMKVSCEEIFGPVVIIEAFDTFDEAIHFINNSKFGLQAGVFTNNLSEVNRAFEEIECGGIIINDVPTFRVDNMPYGGIKDSGLGREGVKYAILDMMEPKILVKSIE
jgi:acyl-CoA reductase-like NAD-dependent aldehyde dehydrogenase